MRKLVVTEALSLDGIMSAPDKWLFPYNTAEMNEDTKARFDTFDAVLLGRKTYQEFAEYWPYQDNSDFGIAAKLNSVAKYVVSNTLETADWHPTTIIRGIIVEEINKLKAQPGKDISVTGSGNLVHSMIELDLVDELRLTVYPVIVGSGKRFFLDGKDKSLKLVHTKTYDSGVIELVYQPNKK